MLMAKRRSSRGKQPQHQSQQKGGTSQKSPYKGMLANNPVKKCYYCGKKGHVQNVCFKKQADDAKRKQASAKHRGYFVEEEDKDFSHEF